jgi:hypothetical protein
MRTLNFSRATYLNQELFHRMLKKIHKDTTIVVGHISYKSMQLRCVI